MQRGAVPFIALTLPLYRAAVQLDKIHVLSTCSALVVYLNIVSGNQYRAAQSTFLYMYLLEVQLHVVLSIGEL